MYGADRAGDTLLDNIFWFVDGTDMHLHLVNIDQGNLGRLRYRQMVAMVSLNYSQRSVDQTRTFSR